MQFTATQTAAYGNHNLRAFKTCYLVLVGLAGTASAFDNLMDSRKRRRSAFPQIQTLLTVQMRLLHCSQCHQVT